MITVPLGVWQAEEGSKASISFFPALPEKINAARQMGYGGVIKIHLLFKAPFWEEEQRDAGFIFSSQDIPTFWTQLPDRNALLTGWIAGPDTERIKRLPDYAILDKALLSLSPIFKKDIAWLRKQLLVGRVHNWPCDPFALGAYAYATVGYDEAQAELARPVENTIFVAGEALHQGSHVGTVEAALASGLYAAGEMMAGG